MREQHDPVVEAMAKLRAGDPDAAGAARAALESLTWGEGLETITLQSLQHFLWYQLSRKWITDLEEKQFLAASLGRLLDLVGLPRYAAVCTSDETAEILATYERDDRKGFAAFQRAEQRSGVAPPDLPELAWGAVMGDRGGEGVHLDRGRASPTGSSRPSRPARTCSWSATSTSFRASAPARFCATCWTPAPSLACG
jgi:hypothetical protein